MVLNSTRVRQLTSLIFEEKFQFKNVIRFQIYNYKDIALQMQPTQFLFLIMQCNQTTTNVSIVSSQSENPLPYPTKF
jgi:hypothetical protein